MGKTSSAVKDRYNAKAYDAFTFRVPKGKKDWLQTAAGWEKSSLNSYLYLAALERMERDALRLQRYIVQRLEQEYPDYEQLEAEQEKLSVYEKQYALVAERKSMQDAVSDFFKDEEEAQHSQDTELDKQRIMLDEMAYSIMMRPRNMFDVIGSNAEVDVSDYL